MKWLKLKIMSWLRITYVMKDVINLINQGQTMSTKLNKLEKDFKHYKNKIK